MRATVRHNQASHIPPFPPTPALIPAVSLLSFPAVSKRESIL